MGSGLKNRKVIKSLGVAAVTGCASIGLTDGIGILLRPGYNPVSQSVSALAVGPTGWVQDVGLYLGGIGIICCAVGLYLVLSANWEVRLGEFFLLVVGLGILFAAIFKTGHPGQADLIPGRIHGLASITAAAAFLPVCLLISPALRDRRKLFIYTITAGILALLLEVGRGRLPSHWALFGLHERLIGANAIIWILVVALVVLVRYRESGEEGELNVS